MIPLNSLVSAYYWPARARKVLDRLEIETFGELVELDANNLMDCKGCGVTTLNDIREILGDLGLSLKGEEVYKVEAEDDMKYVITQSKTLPGFWRVDASSDIPGANGYTALFGGENAEDRAREYATWKNVYSGGSKGGINGGQFRQ